MLSTLVDKHNCKLYSKIIFLHLIDIRTMLNRIIVINSELYAKAAIQIGQNSSIQMTAENNVGKSSFLNTLNFLYITDKDQMRFEDNRKLADSMKHYFDGTSLHSFIIFEIFKTEYYCLLVKATPENTIEYYRLPGAFKEENFIQKSANSSKVKRWDKILEEMTKENPLDPPVLLKGEDLYNTVYNSDRTKNPVVWIKREVKRKGRSFSNSFTEIYRHLIKTSDISEKSFKNALLIADNKQDLSLNVFTSSSFEKINEFEKKKHHLDNLSAVKQDFEKLKLLNDKFSTEENILAKLKHTFVLHFNAIEKELWEKTGSESPLSLSIRELENKIEYTLKHQRDHLITEKANLNNQISNATNAIEEINKQLAEVADFEPTEDNLMFQGIMAKYEEENRQRINIEAQIMQLDRSKFTLQEVENAIKKLNDEIEQQQKNIKDFDNLLYQNISTKADVISKVYTYLSSDVAFLSKSHIKKKITKADLPLSFFDGKIDVKGIELKHPPTVKQLQDEVKTKKKELAEKSIQLEAIRNRSTLQQQVEKLAQSISDTAKLIKKINDKPSLVAAKKENEALVNSKLRKTISEIQRKIDAKDAEITKEKDTLAARKLELNRLHANLSKYREQYEHIVAKNDILDTDETVNEHFDKIYDRFYRVYDSFRATREQRKELKDAINKKLDKDIQDIREFVTEVEEEISNIPQMDKVISNLLDTLSYEIGNPTHSFLTQFNDFKTFIYKSYNAKLAEYPVSNIQSVRVKIVENEEMIQDLEKISRLKFTGGIDFDNGYTESKKALEKQLTDSKGKPVDITDLFTIKVEITKVTGESEEIDLSKQVQSRGTNIVLKLYLFLNILKDLVHSDPENKIVIYVDELDAIGQKNVKQLVRFCIDHNFVPIFAAPRKVEGIQKYYLVKEPLVKDKGAARKPKITFGELQSFPVTYRNAN
jgi:DNA repair exonuclease SbcCD ATPase subunit